MLDSNGIGAVMAGSREGLSPEIRRLIAEKGPAVVHSNWRRAETFSRDRGFDKAAAVYNQEAMAIARVHGIKT